VVAIFHYIESWEKTDHVMVAVQGPPRKIKFIASITTQRLSLHVIAVIQVLVVVAVVMFVVVAIVVDMLPLGWQSHRN